MRSLVILISGAGSNMAAIVQTAERERWAEHLNARVAAVISNRADASGLDLARSVGIATAVVDHTAFADQPQPREAFDAALMFERLMRSRFPPSMRTSLVTVSRLGEWMTCTS